MYLNTANLILSGPGDSTIPSLKFTPDGLVCSTLVENSIETADATSHTDKLTVGTLYMAHSSDGDDGDPFINRDSSGATQTELVIEKKATLRNANLRARTLTVESAPGQSPTTLELLSPGAGFVNAPSSIVLAGPAVFGADGPSEIVYKNRNNSISGQADIQGNQALGGFTLNRMSVIRGEESAPRLKLTVAGNFEVGTQFTAEWNPGRVAQRWDSRATSLTMEKMDPCTAEADLELFAHDLSGIVFSDTPCKAVMQELRLETALAQGPCAKVNLVDNQVNQTGTGAETLYFDNIIILQGWTLEVGNFHIYYTNVRLVNGTVTRNGTVLDESEWDEVLKPACETVYGDFDCDGVIDLEDIAFFCAVYTGAQGYSERADSDCDLVVAGDTDDLRLFRANLRNPDFACNNP